MGCTSDRIKSTEIEECIRSSLLTLKFHLMLSEDLVNAFHRYSPHFHLSKPQISEALKEIGLPIDENSFKIYDLFLEKPFCCKFIERQNLKDEYKNNYPLYSVKKLSTFSLIMGLGKYSEKFRCMFYTYDIDASNELSRWEIGVLISDVLDICFDIIPSISKIFYPQKEVQLNVYIKSLNQMKKNFIEYFKYLILENRLKSVDSDTFVSLMLKKDTRLMIKHSKLRVYAMENFEQCKIIKNEITDDEERYLESVKQNPSVKKRRKKRKVSKKQVVLEEESEETPEENEFITHRSVNLRFTPIDDSTYR